MLFSLGCYDKAICLYDAMKYDQTKSDISLQFLSVVNGAPVVGFGLYIVIKNEILRFLLFVVDDTSLGS